MPVMTLRLARDSAADFAAFVASEEGMNTLYGAKEVKHERQASLGYKARDPLDAFKVQVAGLITLSG